MWWKKTGWFWKNGLVLMSSIWMLGLPGCGSISSGDIEETGEVSGIYTDGLFRDEADGDPAGKPSWKETGQETDGEDSYSGYGGAGRPSADEVGRAISEEKDRAAEAAAGQEGKGYGLPIDDGERKEAEADCRKVLDRISDIYHRARKGEQGVSLDDETVFALQAAVKETGCPTAAVVAYADMENYEAADAFLKDCQEGRRGSQVIYAVYPDGAVGRLKYIFDGTEMYVLSARAQWKDEEWSGVAYMSYTRIKEWKYTEKGWFCYELCVPEPPEVTEIIDGGWILRIKPMTEECRELSKKCVQRLGYQGNNLLCSDWDADHMEALDYNALYEYLYEIEYQEPFEGEDYPEGIPRKEFEELITAYLPVTAGQLHKYADYDGEKQVYAWAALGCFNYAPSFFGTSLPEVTDVRENGDGTVTLTVEAVCDMVIYDDALITHELTVQFMEDGSFRYLGNKLSHDGDGYVPEYQYRLRR